MLMLYDLPVPFIGEQIKTVTHNDADIYGWKCERTLEKGVSDKIHTTIAISWNNGQKRISHDEFIQMLFSC